MNIYGEKTILRAIEATDAELLLDIINDPETERMLGGSSFPVSSEQQTQWIRSQMGRSDVLRCIIADKNTPSVGIGTIILSDIDMKNARAQVHLKLARGDIRGKGYGTDALKTIASYAFNELRLNCLYAEVLEYNSISQKLFEKCGFKKDGLLRDRVYKAGEFRSLVAYSLVKEDLSK